MKLGFYVAQLGLRGTDNFVWKLADTCEQNHNVMILTAHHQALSKDVTQESIDRFRSRFFVVPLMPGEKLDDIVDRYGLQAIYIAKWGIDDGFRSWRCPCIVHAIFDCCQPHGTVYAAISDHMVRKCAAACPVLPFIVQLPPAASDLREQLSIPTDAFVFGRHGGWNQFDLSFVHNAVVEVATERPDVFFVFMNTAPFGPPVHNIKFLQGTSDPANKAAFIETADAMVHGRSDGETFGLAIGEFSLFNKPVVTTSRGDTAHIDILGTSSLVGDTQDHYKQQLMQLLATDKTLIRQGRWDAYARFSPDYVLRAFEQLLGDCQELYIHRTPDDTFHR